MQPWVSTARGCHLFNSATCFGEFSGSAVTCCMCSRDNILRLCRPAKLVDCSCLNPHPNWCDAQMGCLCVVMSLARHGLDLVRVSSESGLYHIGSIPLNAHNLHIWTHCTLLVSRMRTHSDNICIILAHDAWSMVTEAWMSSASLEYGDGSSQCNPRHMSTQQQHEPKDHHGTPHCVRLSAVARQSAHTYTQNHVHTYEEQNHVLDLGSHSNVAVDLTMDRKCCGRPEGGLNEKHMSAPSEWLSNVTIDRIDDYRRIICTFKGTTAVAFDNIAPRAMAAVDDQTLKEITALFDRCEHEETWPTTWRIATMVMIPKTEAYKWRLIAMLCTSYRIWARRAGEDASRWMSSLRSKWVANGPRRASEQAAYDIALEAETRHNDPDDVVVTIMDDLEKGFEKVMHEEILKKAEVYNYPMTKLKLAVSMYTPERRIRCGKAYSVPVTTKVGVLAGCPQQ